MIAFYSPDITGSTTYVIFGNDPYTALRREYEYQERERRMREELTQRMRDFCTVCSDTRDLLHYATLYDWFRAFETPQHRVRILKTAAISRGFLRILRGPNKAEVRRHKRRKFVHSLRKS